MCVAVPLKLTEVNGNEGTGEYGGVLRKFRLDFIRDPKPGEYMIVHAGFAIERIAEETAEETLSLFSQLQTALSGDDA